MDRTPWPPSRSRLRCISTAAAILVAVLLSPPVPVVPDVGRASWMTPPSTGVGGPAGIRSVLGQAPSAEVHRVGDHVDPTLVSVDVSQRTFADDSAPRVLIGRDDVFADNLAGAPLAGDDSPLLLTTGGAGASLRPEVLDEIIRVLDPETSCPAVYLLGGEAAVSAQVEAVLAAEGLCPARLGGSSRTETAVMVAEEVIALFGPAERVLLARADDWADAATGGAWAAATRTPVVITATAGLDAVPAAFLDRARPGRVTLLGGTAALSDAVAADVAGIGGTVDRVSGDSRDATATAIADQLWGGGFDELYLIPGFRPDGWVYALTAAPSAAHFRAPQLAVNGSPDPRANEANRAWVADRAPTVVTVVGPDSALPRAVVEFVLGSSPPGPVVDPLAPPVIPDLPDVPAQPPMPASSAYAFLFDAWGAPVLGPTDDPLRWGACGPIEWRFNPAGAPEGALEDFQEAFARVAALTGLDLRHGGQTSEIPQETPLTAPAIIVGYAGSEAGPPYGNPGFAGYGGLTFDGGGDAPAVVTSGWIVMNSALAFDAGFGPGGRGFAMMHEIGHTLNLDHPAQDDQLMSSLLPPGIDDVRDGDRWAFWRIGSAQGC